jgi:hypothetical protein
MLFILRAHHRVAVEPNAHASQRVPLRLAILASLRPSVNFDQPSGPKPLTRSWFVANLGKSRRYAAGSRLHANDAALLNGQQVDKSE